MRFAESFAHYLYHSPTVSPIDKLWQFYHKLAKLSSKIHELDIIYLFEITTFEVEKAGVWRKYIN
jgi:hypothetical protein